MLGNLEHNLNAKPKRSDEFAEKLGASPKPPSAPMCTLGWRGAGDDFLCVVPCYTGSCARIPCEPAAKAMHSPSAGTAGM